MHSVYSFNTAVRILNQTHRVKWISGQHLNFRHEREIFRPSSRIISTDPTLQQAAQSHQFQNVDSGAETPLALLSKDNLKVGDYHPFKLASIPNIPHNVDIVLRTKELKEVLAQSSFSYDVNVSYNLQRYSSIYSCSFQDANQSSYHPEEKLNFKELDEVLYSDRSDVSHNPSESNKPTKEQLLIVIDELTETLINFFEKPHNYSIYHKNIVFENNIKRVIIRGLTAYIQTMTLLRLCGFVQYAKVKVEILKVTHHVEDGSIRVRWRVKGVPRGKAILQFVKSMNISWKSLIYDEAKWLDGFSVFLVGKDGLIYKHICDKITPDEDYMPSKQNDLKSKLLGLLDIGPRGAAAAGSLQTLVPCCRDQVSNIKRIT